MWLLCFTVIWDCHEVVDQIGFDLQSREVGGDPVGDVGLSPAFARGFFPAHRYTMIWRASVGLQVPYGVAAPSL